MPDQTNLLPEPETQPTIQTDLLEQLLVVAAEKAARNEADQALKKGFVTREQINSALAAFADNLETTLVEKITSALAPKTESIVQKALATDGVARKSTVVTAEDEREADPVAYLLKKGRELGPESYDDTDKRIIWGLTYSILAKDMRSGEEGEE